MLETIFMKLGMYIMTPGPISAAYLINPSHQSASVCVSLLSLLGNGSGKSFPWKLGIIGGNVFYAVRVVSKKIGRSVLPRTCFFICVKQSRPNLTRSSIAGNTLQRLLKSKRDIASNSVNGFNFSRLHNRKNQTTFRKLEGR
jgi:hypothetical protein